MVMLKYSIRSPFLDVLQLSILITTCTMPIEMPIYCGSDFTKLISRQIHIFSKSPNIISANICSYMVLQPELIIINHKCIARKGNTGKHRFYTLGLLISYINAYFIIILKKTL